MYIFLGIVGELASIVGTIVITVSACMNSVLEISKNGYKINKEILDDYQKRQSEIKKNGGIKKALGLALILVPGVNLINAGIKSIIMKKTIMKDSEIKQALVPMTDEEKGTYAKMESKMQKLTFTAFTTTKENEEEDFFGFIGKRPIVVDHGLTSLHHDELPHYDYTLDEVKKLNDATTYSYRIGTIDGKNVAVIGIPNPNSSVSRIQFKAEEYKTAHDYIKISEEEAKDKTFIVYPFMSDINESVEKVIEEIKQSRISSATQANLDALKVQTQINEEYSTEDSKEQQGPMLKKTLYQTKNKKN